MRPKATLRVRSNPSFHFEKRSAIFARLYHPSFRVILGGELAAAGLDIDPAPDADGGGNTGFLQLGAECDCPFAGGCLAGIFLRGVEWDHVDMAEQAFEQSRQLAGLFGRVIHIPDQGPLKGDATAGFGHIIPAGVD